MPGVQATCRPSGVSRALGASWTPAWGFWPTQPDPLGRGLSPEEGPAGRCLILPELGPDCPTSPGEADSEHSLSGKQAGGPGDPSLGGTGSRHPEAHARGVLGHQPLPGGSRGGACPGPSLPARPSSPSPACNSHSQLGPRLHGEPGLFLLPIFPWLQCHLCWTVATASLQGHEDNQIHLQKRGLQRGQVLYHA